MRSIKGIGVILMIALSFLLASACAKPDVDWRSGLLHASPMALSVIEAHELEQGIIFTSPSQVDAFMETKEFKNKLKIARHAKCADVSDKTLLCDFLWNSDERLI